MKKALACLALMALPCLAATIPTTSYICEMSDTSSDNQFDWNIIRGESRYFQVQYQQNGTNANLSDASSTNAYLYLKASDSTNTYRVDGYITDTSNGVVRVLWAATNAPKASVYMVEFAVPDSPEVNLAARGKLTVKNGTGSGVATNMPYYPTLEDDVSGLSTTQALHTAAINWLLQSTQATILATGYLTAGSNVSSLINDAMYLVAADLSGISGTQANHSAWITAVSNIAQTAYGWGNHALVGYLTAGSNVSSLINDSGYALASAKIGAATNADYATYAVTANVASNLIEATTNALMTTASNLFAHGSLTMGYLVSSNNTNEIVWFGDFQRPLTITNLGWFSTVGSATGIVFLADNATAPSAWDSICYTGLAFAAQVRSNDAVSISVTAGQRIGFMASECTNATLFVGW